MSDSPPPPMEPSPKTSAWELWKNLTGFVICALILLFYLVRNLPGLIASGGGISDGRNVATWVLYFLFGSLTLVFGWRTIKAIRSS